jgi:hypothetical protein
MAGPAQEGELVLVVAGLLPAAGVVEVQPLREPQPGAWQRPRSRAKTRRRIRTGIVRESVPSSVRSQASTASCAARAGRSGTGPSEPSTSASSQRRQWRTRKQVVGTETLAARAPRSRLRRGAIRIRRAHPRGRVCVPRVRVGLRDLVGGVGTPPRDVLRVRRLRRRGLEVLQEARVERRVQDELEELGPGQLEAEPLAGDAPDVLGVGVLVQRDRERHVLRRRLAEHDLGHGPEDVVAADLDRLGPARLVLGLREHRGRDDPDLRPVHLAPLEHGPQDREAGELVGQGDELPRLRGRPRCTPCFTAYLTNVEHSPTCFHSESSCTRPSSTQSSYRP